MKNDKLSPDDISALAHIRKILYGHRVLYEFSFFSGPTRDKPGFEREEEVVKILQEDIRAYLNKICSYRMTPHYTFNMHAQLINLLDNILYGIDLEGFDVTREQFELSITHEKIKKEYV